jgi:hypothetical protein
VNILGGDFEPHEPEKPELDSDTIKHESNPGGIENLSSKLHRYGIARQRAKSMEIHLRGTVCTGEASRCAEKLSSCGEWLVLRHYFTVDQLRLVAGNFCQLTKLCPLCAIRRGARNLGVYLERFNYLTVQNPSLQAYLVTLTVRNGPDLKERYLHLTKALRKAVNARRQTRTGNGRGSSEFSKMAGGVGSIEITNRGNGWHPHAHIVGLFETAPEQEKLSHEWFKRTGDSYITDVRPVDQLDPSGAFCEVFKYAMKFQDMSLENNWRAHLDLKRTRLLLSFGLFWGVKVPQQLTDDSLEDQPYVDLFFRYLVESKCYSYDKEIQSDNLQAFSPGPALARPGESRCGSRTTHDKDTSVAMQK